MTSTVTMAFRSRQVPDNRAERRRKLFVRLICTIYWLLIFEGVLRKYVAPHYSKQLFFIRDPFVVAVYLLALTKGMRPQRSIFLILGVAFSAICIPLMILQFASSPYVHSVLLSGYGWRNYFFYLPLAFLIAKYFKLQDFERLMRWTLLCAIPIAVLVFLQYKAPPTSPINQGFGQGEEAYTNPGVANGMVRTYGTFTSGPGEGAFVGSVVAMLLAAWLRPKSRRPLPFIMLVAATAGGLTCLALSGSRGQIVEAGIIFAAAIPATLLITGRNMAFQKLFVPILLVAVAALLAPLVFPKAVDALTTRFANAGYSEAQKYGGGGIFGRAIYEVGSFRYLLASTPPQGYQLGIGGNAAGAISRSGAGKGGTLFDPRLIMFGPVELAAVESDWGRQVAELGPVLGLLFILFRVAFVLWLAKEAVAATMRSGDPLPMLLFAFIGVYLFNGQITGHGTLNGYAWLFAGFCMAINRQSVSRSAEQTRLERRYPRTQAVSSFSYRPQIARS